MLIFRPNGPKHNSSFHFTIFKIIIIIMELGLDSTYPERSLTRGLSPRVLPLHGRKEKSERQQRRALLVSSSSSPAPCQKSPAFPRSIPEHLSSRCMPVAQILTRPPDSSLSLQDSAIQVINRYARYEKQSTALTVFCNKFYLRYAFGFEF